MILMNKVTAIVSLLLFFACDDRQSKEFATLDDGRVLEIVKNGSGQVLDSLTYRNDELDGLQKIYDSDSNTIDYINYVNGKKNGSFYRYSDDGTIKLKGNYFNDNKIRPWYQYFQDGKTHIIQGYTPEGILRYMRVYNKDGSIKTTRGNPFLFINTEKDSMKLNEVIELNFNMVIPKNSVAIYKPMINNDTLTRETIGTMNEVFYYKDTAKMLGNNELELSWKLVDTLLEKVIERGVSKHKFYVLE